MLALLALVASAFAGPTLVVRAEVDDDLTTIRGTLTAVDLPDATWVDALSTLPRPRDAVETARTFPSRANDGALTFTREGDTWTFEATLPRRWGDVGATPKHGLFANGAWYPQPLVDGALPVVTWDVAVTAPEGTVVVVGDAVGDAAATWTGEAERASLAVLPHAHTTRMAGPGHDITIVHRGRRPRPTIRKRLPVQFALAAVEGHTWEGVVVEAPLRRRLVRPGPGVAYLSDRAWRVFPWFQRIHDRPVTRGLLQAFADQPDPYLRDVAGAAAAWRHAQHWEAKLRVDLLGWVKWLPLVDVALYTTEMPFQAELFDRVATLDPVHDDLAERFAPTTPGARVVAQLADRHGSDAVEAWGQQLALGWDPAEAAAHAGVDIGRVEDQRRPYPDDQDVEVRVYDDVLVLYREAPPQAPPESVVLKLDGERRVVELPEGPEATAFQVPTPPRRVVLDPERHVGQISRVGDVQPPPIRWTLWAQIASINASQGFVDAYGVATVRRADDTHNRWQLLLTTTQRKWFGGSLLWSYGIGRRTQPTRRRHTFTVGFDAAWLNPDFGEEEPSGPVTLGGTLAYRYNDRISTLFPREGVTGRLALSGGGIPGGDQTYVRLTGSIDATHTFGTRVVLAGALRAGFADTDIPAERLAFGGAGGVRGLADRIAQTTEQGVASLELRGVPLSQGSVPLGVLWVRDLQVIVGLDAGVGRTDGELVAAVGAVGGIGLITSNLGLSPGAISVTLGGPLWTEGPIEAPDGGWQPEVYVDWGFGF